MPATLSVFWTHSLCAMRPQKGFGIGRLGYKAQRSRIHPLPSNSGLPVMLLLDEFEFPEFIEASQD